MNLNAESMYAAADHLSQSERGYSLDSGNIEACITLVQGFFGAWTGSARDAVAEHLEAGRSK